MVVLMWQNASALILVNSIFGFWQLHNEQEWKPNMATWKHGNMATWQHGNMVFMSFGKTLCSSGVGLGVDYLECKGCALSRGGGVCII